MKKKGSIELDDYLDRERELEKVSYAVNFARRIVKKGFSYNHLEIEETITLRLFIDEAAKILRAKIK